MEFKAIKASASRAFDGTISVTFTVNPSSVKSLEIGFDEIKSLNDIKVEAKKHNPKRSRDANAYFHVLVNQIAEKLGAGNAETKRRLNLEYGSLARNEDGTLIGVVLPCEVDAVKLYEYFAPYGEMTVAGKPCIKYKAYKRTSELDSKEMARLIDGTVGEAESLGIDTATPEERALMIERWKENRT